MQPPPTPPQWSADGQWWWDGERWRHFSETVPPPPVGFGLPPPVPGYVAIALTPSPGLRIFLLVVLSIAAMITGAFSLFGLLGMTGGANSTGDIVLFAVFVVLFGIVAGALVGVAIRAPWSRLAAIVAGIAVSLTCLGLVLGVPILIAAARAPDLSKQHG